MTEEVTGREEKGLAAAPLAHPQGGTSSKKGRQGIFVNPSTGDAIRIWIDTAVQTRFKMIKSLIVSPEFSYLPRAPLSLAAS